MFANIEFIQKYMFKEDKFQLLIIKNKYSEKNVNYYPNPRR